jgi:hypothetical protein
MSAVHTHFSLHPESIIARLWLEFNQFSSKHLYLVTNKSPAINIREPRTFPLTNPFPNPNRVQWHGLLQIIENIPPVHLNDKLLHACLFNFNNLPALDFDSLFSILKESSVLKLIMYLKMYYLPRSL